MEATINITCYKYKKLSNGECPLMVRISKQGKRNYHSLGISIDPRYWDFEKNQPKRNCPNRNNIVCLIASKLKEYQKQLIELKTEDKEFTAKTLIQKTNNTTKRKTIGELFLERIQELKVAKRLGYAENHDVAYKSLLKFNGHLDIYFSDIDVPWLKKYEAWLRSKGNADNTIGIRFRTLRAVYNLAIEQGFVKSDLYPFKSYKVSKLHKKTPKRAIMKDDVMKVINYHANSTRGTFQQLAIDIFAFSYFMGGINFVDIAHLSDENAMEGHLVYTRRKTKQLIKLPLQPKAMEIVLKYRTNARSYWFPILLPQHKTEEQKKKRVSKVIRSVNYYLKTIGKELDIPINLTTYVARHSFATVLKRSGVTTSIISEAMGHSSEKVTQIYLDSFENEQIDEAMSNLL
ncbi:site-specific integrase [uncultured Sanguibacteroides sp.]|uniref:site-specific integrase n=1 Tax=uncultured Sanguibacteroides sp. TaxID=1635151 RepID=UPI0025DCFF0F|nr:site-specific integrase [uncultured Sanguibacteroides sp.]